MPELFDNNSIEQWQAEGSKNTIDRALAHAKKLLYLDLGEGIPKAESTT